MASITSYGFTVSNCFRCRRQRGGHGSAHRRVEGGAAGAVADTLPDLDVLLDHGDPIANMVLHRAESHSLFWLTLFSFPCAVGVLAINRQWSAGLRWWLAMWLALITYPLLDAMTVYGTQLALPFTNFPFAVSSVFIINPLYTMPL